MAEHHMGTTTSHALKGLGKELVSSTVSAAGASTPKDHVSRPQTANGDKAPANAFPEGGSAAWSTVLGAFLVQICAFGSVAHVYFAPHNPNAGYTIWQIHDFLWHYYKRVYLTDESSSAISWIGSINSFMIVAAGLIVGRLYDRGYFYHLLWGGSILESFALFMHSLAKPGAYYQILLSQGIASGLGQGMLYIPTLAVISHYFQRRRALAMTIVATGSSLGAVVHPIMLNNLLNNPSVGFATAARANAGMITGLLFIACLLTRTRLPPSDQAVNMCIAARRFARDGPYVFASLGMTAFIIGFYFPLFYLQLDALTHGLDKTFSFYALVILNASACFGRIFPGFVAHKLGVGNMLIGACFVCSVLILGMIGLGSVTSVVIIGVVYGFFSGIYVSLLTPYIALLTDDLSELGVRMGISFFCVGIGSLVGTPIDGALLTGRYIWWRPAVFSGIMAFTGFGCFVASAILRRRNRQRRTAAYDAKEVEAKTA
ncbi:MFS general substrate transporter [Fomes fomentarius]|nr:MFS general substrate transporter [Fomes fomentarius]